MKNAIVFTFTVLCLGCAAARHTSPPSAPQITCAAASTLPAEMTEPGSVVVFGEIHGVEELPGAFGELVCAEAMPARPVVVGLEIPNTDQPVLDRFLASAGSTADVEALIATDFWSREFQDGRSCRSRVTLIDRLRKLRAAGLPISVVYFDIGPGDDASRREQTMAENIAAAARRSPNAVTMVLVGEVHAWKTKGAPWNKEFVPMGMSLADAGLKTWSIGRATPAGTAWVCTGSEASACGSMPTKATAAALPSGATSGVEALAAPGSHGYDGLYATASLTASPPARKDLAR